MAEKIRFEDGPNYLSNDILSDKLMTIDDLKHQLDGWIDRYSKMSEEDLNSYINPYLHFFRDLYYRIYYDILKKGNPECKYTDERFLEIMGRINIIFEIVVQPISRFVPYCWTQLINCREIFFNLEYINYPWYKWVTILDKALYGWHRTTPLIKERLEMQEAINNFFEAINLLLGNLYYDYISQDLNCVGREERSNYRIKEYYPQIVEASKEEGVLLSLIGNSDIKIDKLCNILDINLEIFYDNEKNILEFLDEYVNITPLDEKHINWHVNGSSVSFCCLPTIKIDENGKIIKTDEIWKKEAKKFFPGLK